MDSTLNTRNLGKTILFRNNDTAIKKCCIYNKLNILNTFNNKQESKFNIKSIKMYQYIIQQHGLYFAICYAIILFDLILNTLLKF